MKVCFVEAHSDADILSAVIRNINQLSKFRSVGLFTTVQHIEKLAQVKGFLEKNGVKVLLKGSQKSASRQGVRASYMGQVLGCDASAAAKTDVEVFLYIGTGEFHPLAIALETDKPVLKLNPHTQRMELVEDAAKKRWLARQAARLSKLKDAKKVGIIVSTKPGQYRPEIANKLHKRFRNSYLFISDTINSQALLDFPDVDVWINTACPRLVEDSWPKPFVNADEVL